MKVLQMFIGFYGVFYKYRQIFVTKYFTNDPEFVHFFKNVKHFRKQQKMLTSYLVKQIKQ